MRNYEVNIIVDPVLSSEEISATAATYSDLIKQEGGKIVDVDQMGLRQLAYPINRRNTGVYYSIEFQVPNGGFIDKLELALRRDERIMRFLTVLLDKYGVKYNEDKRNGLIGKVKPKEDKKKSDGRDRDQGRKPAPKPAPKAAEKAAPKVEAAPVEEKAAPKVEAAPVEEKAAPKVEAAPVEEKAAPEVEAAPVEEKPAPEAEATPAPEKPNEEA
jgi:small subunit ribosomal protein S6